MGAPYFEYKKVCIDNMVTVLSSNYQYYGDMSNRVMTSLKQLVAKNNIEVYSIDEAFLNLDKLPAEDLIEYAHFIKDKVTKWTAIPVSIGIGPTKTLAKIANFVAKKSKCGVFKTKRPATDQLKSGGCLGNRKKNSLASG